MPSQSYTHPYSLPHTNGTSGMGYGGYGMGTARQGTGAGGSRPQYKPSPFYELLEQVGSDLVLEGECPHYRAYR